MAIPTIKSTYALDLETVSALERMAKRWKVSKSEALRRAIRAAAGEPSGSRNEGLAALDEIQESLQLTPRRARAWAERARSERRESSARAERRAR